MRHEAKVAGSYATWTMTIEVTEPEHRGTTLDVPEWPERDFAIVDAQFRNSVDYYELSRELSRR